MGKRTSAWIILICCSLPVAASALSAEDYALAGRMHMSQWTDTGLVQAHDIFDAGINDANCFDCRTNRELIFLRAMTKAAVLFIDHEDVLASDDLLDLADGFGITLAMGALDSLRDDDLCEPIGPKMLPPETDPDHVGQVLGEIVVPELESIVAQLDSIADAPDRFVIVMSPEETGLNGNLEIDYGDVLILKGLFLAYKGVLEMQIVHGTEPYAFTTVPDRIDPVRGVAKGRRLVEWAERLAVLPMENEAAREVALVRQARQDWIDAITQYIDALEYIALENSTPGMDPQEDELTYIDPSSQPHLDVYAGALTTLLASLEHDTVGLEPVATTRTYEVRDTATASIGTLVLEFDGTRFEGHRGHLTRADGEVLEVDWFGLLDADDVGISLFGCDYQAEAWLEGSIDSDRGLIAHATLDIWGASPKAAPTGAGQSANGNVQQEGSGSFWNVPQSAQSDGWDEVAWDMWGRDVSLAEPVSGTI